MLVREVNSEPGRSVDVRDKTEDCLEWETNLLEHLIPVFVRSTHLLRHTSRRPHYSL